MPRICSIPIGLRANCGIVYLREYAIFPKLNFESIEEMKKQIFCGETEECGDGIIKGHVYFPLNPASQKEQNNMIRLLNQKELKKIEGLTFPTDAINMTKYYRYIYNNNKGLPFKLLDNELYEYNGNMYLLVRANVNWFDRPRIKLSQGNEYQEYKDGDYFFLKVGEIELYADLNKKFALFADMLVAGIPLNHTGVYPQDLTKSDMGQYLPLIIQSIVDIKKEMERIKGIKQPYTTIKTDDRQEENSER